MENLPSGSGTQTLERPQNEIDLQAQQDLLQQQQADLSPSTIIPNTEGTYDTAAEVAVLDSDEADIPALDRTIEDPQELVVGITGTGHDARLYAKDAGHERHLSHLEDREIGGVHRITRKIWSNISSGAHREKLNLKARQEIEANEHGNVLMHLGVTDEEYKNMARDTITRFTGEYEDTIDRDAGEHRSELSDESDPNAVAIKGAVKGLLKEYANGNLTDDTFNEEKNRILADLAKRGITKDLLGEGATFADNLHDIAKSVVKRINNERGALGADEVIDNLKFVVGEARIGSRTEANKNAVERLSDKLNCRWINETTAVAAASTLYAVGRWSTKSVTSAATRFGVFGVGSGVWAGIRARSESKSERTLLAREHAMGVERDDPASKLEQKLTETLHDSKNAGEIINDLSSLFDDEGKLNVSSPDDIRDVTALLADVQARQTLAGRNKIDLIDYSDIKKSASERLQLMTLTARLHTQLADKFNALPEADRRSLAVSGTFDILMEKSKDSAIGALSESISEKDALANRLHNIQFAKAFAKGTILGAGIGEVAQELTAIINPDEQGAVEGLFHHDSAPTHATFAAGLLGESHHQATGANVLSGHTANQNLYAAHDGSRVDMTLPKEFSMQKGPDGFTLTAPDGKSVSGLNVDSHGQLTPHSLQEMRSVGLNPVDKQPHYTPVEHVTSHHAEVSRGQFVHNHAGQTTRVTRVDFANNGTSNPDGNELRLDTGARNGFDAKGNVVLSMKGMENGQSVTSGGHSIDPHTALREGKLSAYISVGRDSQTTPFKVPIRADGTIVIPHDSPLRQMFTHKDGQFHFKGGFIEVAQNGGHNSAGVEQITPLATVVGNNDMHHFQDVVQTKTVAAHYQYSFQPTPVAPVEHNLQVDVPPVLPFYFRNTLKPRAARSPGTDAEPLPLSPREPISVRQPEAPRSFFGPERPLREPALPINSAPEPNPRDRLAIEGAPSEERDNSQEAERPTRLEIEPPRRAEQPKNDAGGPKPGTDKPSDDNASSSGTKQDDTAAQEPPQATPPPQQEAAPEEPAQPEWEEGDQQRSAKEMALKYGFPFADSLPYANRWNSSVWARATQLLKQTMASAENGETANGRMLSRTILLLEQEASAEGNEDYKNNIHRTGVDAGVRTLLTEVLSNYRASRKQAKAA